MGRPAKKLDIKSFNYLDEINRKLKTGKATEPTYYPALQYLIEQQHDVQAINQPQRVKCGAPDFIVEKNKIPVGYIEAKDINTNLTQVEKSEQLERYLSSLNNLILTDYLTFKWYINGELQNTIKIGKKINNRIIPIEGKETELEQLISSFLSTSIPTIKSALELAKNLANKTKIINSSILKTFELDDSDSQWLHRWLKAFQDVLLKNLKKEEFSDMFSQTLTYGFFAAWIHHTDNVEFSRFSAAKILPKTNPFLRKLFAQFVGVNMPDTINWAVDNIVEILRHTDKKQILQHFNVGNRKDDPVVHFYETFLADYNPKLKEMRGVFYTPQPVVNYIVKSTDLILKKHFKKEKGLADDETLILDPATGTGSFLFKVLEQVSSNFKHNKGIWNSYVSDKLLKRLYGFEILMAPYSVAHLKLGIQLQETGYNFKKDERLAVYLTNTLEEAAKKSQQLLFEWISEEANKASDIKKDKPIMVILGNPPYSGESANKGKWINNLLKGSDLITGKSVSNYFECNGHPLKERNLKWLNDDYVKFIRFAQWRIEQTGYGVISFITNHSFLENITFRGMRESILQTFDEIYVLNLHGSVRKKQQIKKSKDENVFDIQQGVSINFFIKKENESSKKKKAKVFCSDILGTRLQKYDFLSKNTINNTQWTEVKPVSPYYLFKTQDHNLWNKYNLSWKISDLFPLKSLGIVTARDSLTIHFSEKEIWGTVQAFSNLTAEEARHKYNLKKDSDDWQIALAQKDLKNTGLSKKKVHSICYRPFDKRFTYYTGQSKGFHCRPREKIMKYMLGEKNIALNICRQTNTEKWSHVLVTDNLTEACYISNKTREISYTIPLFRDGNEIASNVNLKTELINTLEKAYKARFKETGLSKTSNEFTAKEIFYYIYAVLHSNSFRHKFGSVLKIDFPRVPFVNNKRIFKKLSGFGEQLTSYHTLNKKIKSKVNFPEKGSNIIDKIKFSKNAIWINKTQYFNGISADVWNFQVGGYMPAQKWLKSRKRKKLTYDELITYPTIIESIARTIEIQTKIDKFINDTGGWDTLLKDQIRHNC